MTVPTGMRYADVFLVNGGNGGAYTTSSYTYRGEGGNVLTQNDISVSGSISITIGAAGSAGTSSNTNGGKGGTTSVTINGTVYSPATQPNNSNRTKAAGTDGTANPFGMIGSTVDADKYGASGGTGRLYSTTGYPGGTTGGGTGASSMLGFITNAAAGSFYGAGGGGGLTDNKYIALPAAGYQGCVIIRWKSATS